MKNYRKFLKKFIILFIGIFILFYINSKQNKSLSSLSFYIDDLENKGDFSDTTPFFKTNFATKGIVQSVHCSTVIEIADNKIRAFWYGGMREGSSDVAIFTSVYSPLSDSWSENIPIITAKTSENDLKRFIKKIGNVSVVRDLKNRIWLFYVSVSFGGWGGSAINYIISDDDGKTWSSSKRLITSPFLNISTLVKGRPFLYKDGSIGVPVYHEFLLKFAELLRIDSFGNVIFKKRLSCGRKTLSPEVLILNEKNAYCFLRYTGRKDRFIYYVETNDGGLTWTKPEKTTLPNHNSAFTCLKLKNDIILKVLNNSDKERDDLTLVASKDSGKTWKEVFVFEDEETIDGGMKHEFSYPWLLEMKSGDFHLFYTWRRKHIKHIQFNNKWLKNKL